MRNLYQIGYNAEQVREMFGLIDWMMHLRFDLEKRFKQELDQFEKCLQMPYVTSVERIAKAEGKAEGVAGRLIEQLDALFGPLSEERQQQIRRLRIEQLTALGRAILDFDSLEDLEVWLEANSWPPTTDH